jgi:type III secretion protein J
MMNWPPCFLKWAYMGLLVCGLTACSSRLELYTQLTEHQANEMVALLQTVDMPAQKEQREPGVYAVLTASENFSRAIELLHANGLPQGAFESVGQLFKKEGLVSSPIEERARLTYALSQELASTLQTIDGVVLARVHLALPEKDPLVEKTKPASASVFVKYRAGRDLSGQVSQIKALVVNGVEGLPYDKVTVALFPAEAPALSNGNLLPSKTMGLKMPLNVLIALCAGLLVFGGLWVWQRRRRMAKQPATSDSFQPTASLSLVVSKEREHASR